MVRFKPQSVEGVEMAKAFAVVKMLPVDTFGRTRCVCGQREAEYVTKGDIAHCADCARRLLKGAWLKANLVAVANQRRMGNGTR